VAYCEVENGPTTSIKLVQEWPGNAVHGNKEKVPSRIAYLPPKPGSTESEVQWGDLISWRTRATVHACMKLAFDEKQSTSPQASRLLMALLTSNFDDLSVEDIEAALSGQDTGPAAPPAYPGKDNIDIVADYLTHVKEAAYADMQKRIEPALFASMRKEVVVTVPAVWSERAKDLTMKAVSRADWGADKYSMVTEPEAAAIYTLREMSETASQQDLKVGDTFVLCDAGGGTVDLISYRLTQIEPIFRIEEAAVGSGDKCGATYIEKVSCTPFHSEISTTRPSHNLTFHPSPIGILELARNLYRQGTLRSDPPREASTRE
jgi:hypothetical protein